MTDNGPVRRFVTCLRSSSAVTASAVDRFVSPERLLLYPAAVLIGSVVVMAAAIALGDMPFIAGGNVVLPDFLAHWTGGRMMLDGDVGVLYDPFAQKMLQTDELREGPLSWFVSPPFSAYLYVPFAMLDYGTAALAWTVFSAACLVAAGHLVRPFAPRLFRDHARAVYLVLLATQPVFELLGSGQDTGVSVLLWVAGIRLLLAGRDVLGGSVLALGLFKPQLFFIVPIVLVVQGRWRALAAWAATAAALALLSVRAVGVGGVVDWVQVLTSDTFHSVVQTSQAWKMQSLPALATTLGLSSSTSGVVAVAVVLVVVVQLWRARSRGVAELPMWMLAMTATAVASPHLVVYDLVVALVSILWIVEHIGSRTTRLSCVALFVLTWTIPVRHVVGGPFEAAWSAIPLTILWVVLACSIGVTGRTVPDASRRLFSRAAPRPRLRPAAPGSVAGDGT